MVQSIKILPDHVINKIAAGEVVERPASVVKELIENAIDAGATEILIDIEQAGRRCIRITDNGSGMSKEDARLAFERHATSKITSDRDLEAVRTMGFRGEALSSIASVAHVRMITTEPGALSGTIIEIEGGRMKGVSDGAGPRGTSVEISNLFYNTPARLKFLKSAATELSHILTTVSRQAMAHPSLRIRLTHNRKPVLDLPSSMTVKERAVQIYGNEIAEHLIEFSGGRDDMRIEGLLGRPGYTRADKTYQDFYVNGRAVRNAALSHALYAAHADMLMRDRHPVGFIFMEIDPALVDVNVHPSKAEVRFRNQSQIHDTVRDVIREGLRISRAPSPGPDLSGIRESVSEYIQNADFGMGNGGLNRNNSVSGRMPVPSVSSGQSIFEIPFEISSDPAIRAALIPLAQVHDSFIIAQSVEGMAIIDQHAAHERVLFEKLQNQYSNGNISIQILLLPVQVELGSAQSTLLSDFLPEIEKFGFTVEDFGKGTFMIKAVPSLLAGADYKRLLLDILDELNIHGRTEKMNTMRDDIFSVMACHPAIKVHRRLDVQEMERLLADLSKCRMPHTCPHGRPTTVKFSIDEMKKMFKRI